jgi:hypothetical protein
MNDRVLAKNKTSVTPPVATPASSPLLRRQLTEEVSESVGSNSNISKELGGVQPKTIRRRLNWQNITVEAPNRSSASSTSPGGIQRLETSDVKEQEESKEEQNKELVQTKLTVGAPGDKYEQEADSMAAKVMRMPDSAIKPPIQRQTGEDTEAVQMQPLVNFITPLLQRSSGEEEEVQMKSGLQRASDGSSVASGNVENQLAGSKGGGSALPDDVRSFMEPRFGADFSSVRVHTDSNAVQMNKELGAQAFAHGSDIYYGAGKSPGKNELTAHELTHTIQQTGAAQLNKSVLPKPEPEQEEKQPLQAKKLSSSTPEVIQNKLGTGIAPRIQANQQRQSTEPSQFSTTQSESIPLQRAPERVEQPEGSVNEEVIFRLSQALGELTPDRREKARKDTLALRHDEIELVVKSAGDWNKVKDTYVRVPNLMKQILAYRVREVLNIYNQACNSNEQLSKLDLFVGGNAIVRNSPIEMVAAGSNDLTSDYDVTFAAGAGNEKLESLAVREFNKFFRQKWALESGIVFDTNVYTTGHMRAPAFKGDGKKLKLVNNLVGKVDKLQNFLLEEIPPQNLTEDLRNQRDQKRDEMRNEINNLVGIINGLKDEGTPINLGQLEWSNVRAFTKQITLLQNKLTPKVGQEYKDSKESYGAGPEFDDLAMVMSLVHMKEFWKEQPKDEGDPNWDNVKSGLAGNNVPGDVKILNAGRLDRASEIHTELVKERTDKIKQAEEQLRQKDPKLANDRANIEMRANNLLYEEYLLKIDEKRDEVEKAEENLRQIRKAEQSGEQSGEQSKEALKQVNALKLQLQTLQSKAMFFANEAYMTAIAAEQVVLNQQMNLNVELPTAQYLASINEQMAFLGHQILDLKNKFSKALWKTSKYIDRILTAIETTSKQVKATLDATSQTAISDISAQVNESLDATNQTVNVVPSEEIMKKVGILLPLVQTLKNIKSDSSDKDGDAEKLASQNNNQHPNRKNSEFLGASSAELAGKILNLATEVNNEVQSYLNLLRNSNQ